MPEHFHAHPATEPCVFACIHSGHKGATVCTPGCRHIGHASGKPCPLPCAFVRLGRNEHTYCVGSGSLHTCPIASGRTCRLALASAGQSVLYCPASSLTAESWADVPRTDGGAANVQHERFAAPFQWNARRVSAPVARARRQSRAVLPVAARLRRVVAIPVPSGAADSEWAAARYEESRAMIAQAREQSLRQVQQAALSVLRHVLAGPHRRGVDQSASVALCARARQLCREKGATDPVSLADALLSADPEFRVLSLWNPLQDERGRPPERELDAGLASAVAAEIASAYCVLAESLGQMSQTVFAVAYIRARARGILRNPAQGTWILEPLSRLDAQLPSPSFIMACFSTWTGPTISPRNVRTAIASLPHAVTAATAQRDWPPPNFVKA